jgi:hypothetical protein
MSRSSTSSSEPAAPRAPLIQFRPRIFSAGFAAIAAAVLLAELVLRLTAVRDAMPIRTHLHEPGVVVRMQTLDALTRQVPNIDVLFIGSSIVRCNIRPLLFDQLLRRRGVGVVSFNAGMSGLWPRAVDLYAQQLWLPRARPRVVVQGIRFGELFPSRNARRYEAIVTSPVESAWRASGPWAWARAAAFERIHLLQYRGIWPAWLQRFANGRSAAPEDDEQRVFTDARGWTPRLPTLDVVRARRLLKDERPNPNLAAGGDVHDALEAIRDTARAARRGGAAYVLVNVPEHAFRWSGDDGDARYGAYLEALRGLAAPEGFAFVDVTDGDRTRFSDDRDYSDYHHMSPDGATRFTTMLASAFDTSLVRSAAERVGAAARR